jgi:hypothetical protein
MAAAVGVGGLPGPDPVAAESFQCWRWLTFEALVTLGRDEVMGGRSAGSNARPMRYGRQNAPGPSNDPVERYTRAARFKGGGLIRGGSPMWTSKNRARYDRSKLRYPSDLTDDEWRLVEPLSRGKG